MIRDDDHVWEKVLIASAGFIGGVLVGLVFAPSRGSETRRQIADVGRRVRQQFRKTADEQLDRLQQSMGNMLDRHFPVVGDDLKSLDREGGKELVKDLARLPK